MLYTILLEKYKTQKISLFQIEAKNPLGAVEELLHSQPQWDITVSQKDLVRIKGMKGVWYLDFEMDNHSFLANIIEHSNQADAFTCITYFHGGTNIQQLKSNDILSLLQHWGSNKSHLYYSKEDKIAIKERTLKVRKWEIQKASENVYRFSWNINHKNLKLYVMC